MKIKYVGTRPCVSMCCTGRQTYYFGQENDMTVEVINPAHASQILSSEQHRFEVVLDNVFPQPKPEEVMPEEISEDEVVEDKPIKKQAKKGKK